MLPRRVRSRAEGLRSSSGGPAGGVRAETASSRPSELGNLAVRRLIQRATPLAVSRPGDASERRADDLAARVADGPATGAAARLPAEAAAPEQPGSADARALVSRLGAGRALGREERAALEARLGGDLGRVRVHTGGEAQVAAAGLRARAFAVGNHVAFGADEYQPGSREGQRLLAHEVAHTLQPGGADVQRTPIPTAAPLADFVGLTQQAIDDVHAGHGLTVGPEVVALLQGLRNHVTLQDANGRVVVNGGSFVLDRTTAVLPIDRPMPFRLVVDDTTTPTLGGLFSAGTIVVQAAHFRGSDTESLGQSLFHEMVHALVYLRRERPTLAMRPDVNRGLDLSRHAGFVPHLQHHLDYLFPSDPRNARVANALVEEIVAIVETEVHTAWASGQPGIRMPRDEFVPSMRAHLFGSGIAYTAAEGVTAAADSGALLNGLFELLYQYYLRWAGRRRFETGIMGEGLHLSPAGPPMTTPGPTLPSRSFIPNLIQSADEI